MVSEASAWVLAQLADPGATGDPLFQIEEDGSNLLTQLRPHNDAGEFGIQGGKSLLMEAARHYHVKQRRMRCTFDAAGYDNANHENVPALNINVAVDAEQPQRCFSPDLYHGPRDVGASNREQPAAEATDVPVGIVSAACLHALLGCSTVIPKLRGGDICTASIRPLALQRMLEPICEAAIERVRLDVFLQKHGLPTLHSTINPTLQAFVRAVATVLRHHTQRLQAILHSVEQRRLQEAGPTSADDEVETAQQPQQPPTPLEILQHTRQLRRQVATLARLCWCSELDGSNGHLQWQAIAFPTGNSLLEHLFSGVLRTSLTFP